MIETIIMQNVEAEEAILGGILLDPEAIGRVAEMLQPESFSLRSHQIIYKAALALHFNGTTPDMMTVTTWLSDQKLLEKVGGQLKIVQLLDRTVSAVNIDQYGLLVSDKQVRRNLINSAHKIIELAEDTSQPLETVIQKSEEQIAGISQGKSQQDLVSIGETLIGTFQDIEDRSTGATPPGVPCGFYDLDAMTGGFQRSDLIIVAGRPAMGKCLSFDSQIILSDGSITTIEDIYRQKKAQLLTLGSDWKFKTTKPSDFIDDGIKPVFRVTTKLGRFVESTLTHPFLTIQGWRPLGEIKPGNKIAVPRQVDVFGTEKIPGCQVKILGYLIGDGGLTDSNAVLTNNDCRIQQDFIDAVKDFDSNLKVRIDSSNGTRANSLNVVKNQQSVIDNRQSFAKTLRQTAQVKGMSGFKIAEGLGVTPSAVSHWMNSKSAPNSESFKQLCDLLGVDANVLTPDGTETIQTNSRNSMVIWLEKLGLWGKNSHQKTIPEIIFKLERSQVALFLNRLFATDGWASVLASGQSQMGYTSVSEELARQVQHLLLRFGVVSTLKKRSVKYKETRRTAWQLDITDALSLKTFISEIGIFSKEEALSKVQQALTDKPYHTNRDLIPVEIWEEIATAKGIESWQGLAKRAGILGYTNIHVGKRQLSRERLWTLASALDNLPLQQLATSEIYWDEIVSIESMGEKQVYDLTIPETHNFVANDICVHNTALAVQFGHKIAKKGLPVAIFSLEMSKGQLVQRLLAAESKIEFTRLQQGLVQQEEWEPLTKAVGTLAELPIYIDDSSNPTVAEIRGKAKQLKLESDGKLGLILIDYLQLMEGASDNRVQELSRITRGLKGMAKDLNVPVIALSQLNRSVEQRTNKRPMLSDLRESGSTEQDADLVMMIYRDDYYNPNTSDGGVAEIILAKHRNGPTGTVKLLFDPQYTQFKNLAKY